MKTLFRHIVLACLLLAFAPTASEAREKLVPKMYMFGFSFSFNDSIVYFTDIQEVDSTWTDQRSNFIVYRNQYANQMRDTLERMGLKDRTSTICYSEKRRKVEKRFVKMRRRYTTKTSTKWDVRYLDEANFRFVAVKPDVIDERPITKAERKAEKKAAKEAKKKQKNGKKH